MFLGELFGPLKLPDRVPQVRFHLYSFIPSACSPGMSQAQADLQELPRASTSDTEKQQEG
jgi:hypothetical protein